MLPRRCKKCRCYIAPHLTRCPRCNAVAPPVIVSKQTKEEKSAERAKRDAKVPVIRGQNIHWIPSAFALRASKDMVEELKRRLAKAETPRQRNGIRSELRLVNAKIARATASSDKHAWTTELFRAEQACIHVYISPKRHRYALAERDAPADLLIAPRTKSGLQEFIRLQRFEKSPYARMVKKEQQEQAVHTKRKKAKTVHRAKKRMLKKKHTLL